MERVRTSLAGLIGIATISALAGLASPVANAQQGAGSGTPVLVIIDDEDRAAVIRSSGIARRFLAELAGAMPRVGLRMVDGESVAGDLGLQIPDRLPRQNLLNSLKDMRYSNKAEHFHRAWVLLQTHVTARSRSMAIAIQVRITGEIYDARDSRILDAISLSPESFPAPMDCLESSACVNEVVGDHARKLATILAETLARKLNRHPGLQPHRTGSSSGDDGNRYMVTLRDFTVREALTIVGVMGEEFPGFRSIDLIRKSPRERTYEYVSSAKAAKLDVWFDILLTDMGFETAGDVVVTIDGAGITIEKVIPATSEGAQEAK